MQFLLRLHPNKKKAMRSYYFGCFGIFLLMAFTADAQMPSMLLNGKESNLVYLQKLEVNVVIDGAIATTTWTMTFKNSGKQTLEGELNFPLPQGVPVSSYALDINGVLREAVPVEKAKATMVFENTERRRVDPGLLEKVDGNTFRTRIYPINAEGVRVVRIGYEQELSWQGQRDLQYKLPLAFTYPIEEFSLHISVPGASQRPQLDGQNGGDLDFGQWKQVWSVEKKWKDYRADQPISIRIPQTTGAGAILMQQVGNHYFYAASVFPKPERIEKAVPHHIAILWDASLSGLRRDRKKEFELLEGYLTKLADVTVDLVSFSNKVGESRKFTVHNGGWQSLKKALQEVVYDGGTQFGALRLADYPCDEYLLFSDGHSSFGSDRIQVGDRPVYSIVAVADADYPFLQALSQRTGGELINLNEVAAGKARELLAYESLQFLGVRNAEGLEESYPSMPTTLTGGLTVAGISYKPVQTVVLQFGYGKRVVREEKVELDFARQQDSETNVSRIWAEKKIAELDTHYEDNKEDIKHLGRSYGIVTRNTSLMVLENIMDYVTYDIEPPLELRDQYDQLLKGREQNRGFLRRQVADNAEQYFNELLSWWNEAPQANQQPDAPAMEHRGGSGSNQRQARSLGQGGVVADTVAYVPRAASSGGQTGTIRGSVAGMQTRTVTNSGEMIVHAQASPAPPAASQDQVVVTGMGVRRNSNAGYLPAVRVRGTDEDKEAGPAPGGGSFTILKADVDTKYLGELKAAAPANRYALYLQLRKDYLNTPLFYYHTAELFLGAGEKEIGLRILSNIAELNAENYELYKLMGYKLKELGEAEAACATFLKVLDWRPFEPQSYRDYGLALEDAGHYQQALDTLYLALTKNYDARIEALYPGIEETLLPEINELIALHPTVNVSSLPKKLLTNMPVDMRVVLNWNQNNTDIDLWVTDPDNERCFYGHRTTAMGGRISHDFTRGLGPEQFMLKKAEKGRYKVEVSYYGDTQVKIAGETVLLVEVYTNYGTPQQKRSLVTLQLKKGSKGGVYVGEFNF